MKERCVPMLKAPVNKIIDHSLVDGIGNRSAIFFQGCNIACKYCHNPETQKLCNHCQVCVAKCPVGALTVVEGQVTWNSRACIKCDTCIHVCPNDSSPKVTDMTVDEVFDRIAKNLPFIRGITVSGGECSLYTPFLQELFGKCKNIGITCLMDCNGTIPFWNKPVMEVCDGIMLDVKAWSDQRFRNLTGGDNEVVKQNLRQLSNRNKLEELRIVCLEDYVDAEDTIKGIADYVSEQTRENVLLKLIRFRHFGVKGELKEAASPSYEYMEKLKQIALENGFDNVRIV